MLEDICRKNEIKGIEVQLAEECLSDKLFIFLQILL
jgi:hypothetical protein